MLDDEVFKGKTLSGLFKDIYKKSQQKDRQIKLLIGELKPLIKNIGDATIIVPLIKEYMDVSIKNDDHIIKMTSIVQRLISAQQRSASVLGSEGGLTEAEKRELLSDLDDIEADINESEENDLDSEIEDIKNKLNNSSEEDE